MLTFSSVLLHPSSIDYGDTVLQGWFTYLNVITKGVSNLCEAVILSVSLFNHLYILPELHIAN